jgi:hypothetical protein
VSRGGTRIRAQRKPVVVIAGEHRNDRQALRALLEAFCPEMRGRLVEINDTVRLRDASSATLRGRVRDLARIVRARAVREAADVACVFVHEDLDQPDGDRYTTVRERVQNALTHEFGNAHYVLAVAEVEAWLLLFPTALSGLVQAWNLPAKYRGCDTGRLGDPKQIMVREVTGASRRYRESDAPEVFKRAVSTGCLDKPDGTNRSWTQLRADSELCCQEHIPTQRGMKDD